MSEAGQDDALGVEPQLEAIADRLERGMVSAGDDERRQAPRGQRLERDVRFPGPALADEDSCSLQELRWQRDGRVEVRPDGR